MSSCGPAAIAMLSLLILAPASVAQTTAIPHYEGTVTLSPAEGRLSGTLRIRFRLAPGAERAFLIGRTFKVTALEADGADVSISDTEQPFPGVLQAIVARARAGAGRDVTLRLTYSGTLTQLQQPPINSVTPDLIELAVDSFWLPTPAALMSGLTADVVFKGIPAGHTVVSNGVVTRVEGGVRVQLTDATDLALVAAPRLREHRDGKLLFYAEDPDGELAMTYRKHGALALAQFEAAYGPLPGGEARVVIVPRAAPNGYNRRGYFVVSTRAVPTSEAALAISLAHEIAHSWWWKADPMGPHYWLVEGPAEYSGFRYGKTQFGDEVMAPRMERARSIAGKAGPVVGTGRSPDGAIYSKAMLLLTDLEQRLGDAKMERLLRRVAGEREHTTAVFLRVLADEAGIEVAQQFERRLKAPD